MATIITKNSSTASSVPAAGSLQQGELAVNVTDKKLYTKDSSAAVVKLVGSLGNQEANAVAITGGTINGTAIGGTTPAAAAFTTASASGGFTGNLTGNASTVTNGVYTTGSYADPAWITSLAGSKITGNISGNAANVTGTVAIANGGTGLTALGTGVQTALGQTVTGSGGIVLAASPSLTTPNLGTPSAVTLTNATGLPVSTGISGLGTNVATALGVSVGSVGSVVVNGGALGTPSSGTLTNATGLPLSTGVTGTLAVANGGTGITAFGSGVATALGVNVGSAGAFVVNGGALGTPSSGTVTNLTGTASININGTVGATTPNTGSFTTLTTSSTVTINGGTANGVAYLNGSKVLTTGSALTFDGTNFATTGTASATKFIATGGTATGNGMYLPAANTLAFSTNGAERIRVDSSGLVGIGTSSPTRQLDVSGAGQNIARFTSSGASTSLGLDNTNANAWGSNISFATGGTISGYFGTIGGILGNTTQDLAAYANTGNGFRVYTNGNNLRAIVTSAGDVGIGTSSPTARLHVNGDIRIADTSSLFMGVGAEQKIFVAGGANSTYLTFNQWTGSAYTERMRLDSSGNLGLGVTPSAWGSPFIAFQVGTGGAALSGRTDGQQVNLSTNWRFGSGTNLYIANGHASRYAQESGLHAWYTAPSGTAGNAISFTQAMTLDASGNLGVGTTSPSGRLHVSGTGSVASIVLGTSAGSLQVGSTSVTGEIQANESGAEVYVGTRTNHALVFRTNLTERARITSGGEFIVGNSVANGKLDVYKSVGYNADAALYSAIGINDNAVNNNAVHYWRTGLTGSATGQSYVFQTLARTESTWVERARITSGGDLLVGTADAGATTGVGVKTLYSATIPSMHTVFNTAGGGNAYHLYNTNATNNGYRFYVGVNGGISNYQANNTNLSDVRLKKDIADASNYLDKICAIPVRTFRYKDQSDDALNLGVIAQEVEAIAPELVNNDGFGETPDDSIPLKTIYQTDLQYALMKALQELKAELDTVKAELATLKGNP